MSLLECIHLTDFNTLLMITYKYRREDGTTFTVEQSIDDDPLEECPDTGQKCERVIGAPMTITYKDDGYHHTDYEDSDNPAA